MAQNFALKDYYHLLNISSSATETEIRTAFRKLARETHPDLTGDAGNYERFILIREAYDILTNRKTRDEYDAVYRAWHSGNTAGVDSGLDSAFSEFDPSDNRAYGDEWEYFKLHPDDYLDLFKSSVRMFLAGFLAIIVGTLTPLAVFSGIMGVIALFILMTGTIISALITTSMSSVAGIIIAILLFRKARSFLSGMQMKGVSIFGKMVVYPLRGIPLKYGKAILYLNFFVVFVITALFGYHVITWVNQCLPTDSLPREKQFFAIGALVLLTVFSVYVIVSSLVLIYEIVAEALKRYPNIRYTRIRVKKHRGIDYTTKPSIGMDR